MQSSFWRIVGSLLLTKVVSILWEREKRLLQLKERWITLSSSKKWKFWYLNRCKRASMPCLLANKWTSLCHLMFYTSITSQSTGGSQLLIRIHECCFFHFFSFVQNVSKCFFVLFLFFRLSIFGSRLEKTQCREIGHFLFDDRIFWE